MDILLKDKNESDYQYAFRVMFDQIVKLKMEPGSVLAEGELMEAMKLGRTPIREAIMRLRDYRLADVQPKKKSLVSLIDLKYVEEGVLVREAIESRVLEDAARNIHVNYIEVLSKNIEEQEEAVKTNNHEKMWQLDNEFHRLIYFAAGKPWSWEIVTQATTHLDRVRRLMLNYNLVSDAQTFEGHREMYDIIISRKLPLKEGFMYTQLTQCYRGKLPNLINIHPDYFDIGYHCRRAQSALCCGAQLPPGVNC